VKSALAGTVAVLRRLGLAVPNAWRDDVVFRWASIGAGACLLTVLLDNGAKHTATSPGAAPPPLPPSAVATAPMSVPAPPAKTSLSSPAAGPPRIAPGRPLNNAASAPPDTPDTDRFGTLQPHQ
jgi:hypothetical protein